MAGNLSKNSRTIIGKLLFKNIPMQVACHVNFLLLFFHAISACTLSCACHIYNVYTYSYYTLQHSLLLFSIHYYHSSFTITIHHLLLPFIIHYCPSSITTTINYYPSSFTTTFIIHYYPLSFTTALHQSLLPFIIHYYPSSFTTTLHQSLLPFIIHYYPSSFTTTTAVDMVVPKGFPALCTPYVQVVHQPWKCTVHKSWKCLHRGSVQEVSKSCKKCFVSKSVSKSVLHNSM